MMINNLLSQKMAIDMRIYFRGSDLFMSQHLLNHPNIGASFEQMGSKRMAENMRTYLLLQPHQFCIPFYVIKNGDTGYRLAT